MKKNKVVWCHVMTSSCGPICTHIFLLSHSFCCNNCFEDQFTCSRDSIENCFFIHPYVNLQSLNNSDRGRFRLSAFLNGIWIPKAPTGSDKAKELSWRHISFIPNDGENTPKSSKHLWHGLQGFEVSEKQKFVTNKAAKIPKRICSNKLQWLWISICFSEPRDFIWNYFF